MLIGETISVALNAIRTNKLRSFLTTLGIVIGVGAVITVVALGNGARKSVEDQIQSLGTDLLSVYPGQQFNRGVATDVRVSLTVDDAIALEADATRLKNVVPELGRNLQVKYLNQNINVLVLGTTDNYPEVQKYKLDYGRMFTPGDNEGRRRVAVLGSQVPKLLGTNGPAMIGTQVMMNGIPFEVIGLFAEKGAQGSMENPDERILIPMLTGRYRVFGNDRLRNITVQVASQADINTAMIEIEGVLRRQHKIRPGGDNDFQIRNRTEFLATVQGTAQTFTFLLAGIAAVSLVVGGIGIMNIMLVSVTERTREIGTRKALGATKKNIMFQFLVEATVLCMLGGIVGILIGTGTAVALAKLANWNTLVSPFSIMMSFAFSAIVGIFFGLWPARRAAKLDPITALRYE